jgi:ABC-type nitrate/sulfonate/bicarbonate transport system ATPase subunit
MLDSILIEGMLMPFAVWEHDDKKYLLDGHGRFAALVRGALSDPSILTQRFPYVAIDAATEDDARKALLQITSQYGRITKNGVIEFTASIPEYRAPAISKYYKPVTAKREAAVSDFAIIRLRVPKDQVPKLTSILKQVQGIEVY